MVAVNRTGTETLGGVTVTFYGSSFISDCYGRVLVAAPRDTDCVLVADVDLDARRDWLELFPFLSTRRPETYGPLVEPDDPGISGRPGPTGSGRPTAGRSNGPLAGGSAGA
jgi:N-carbamoylputrescine amidase